jgi:polysaccharide deacetylase family protein (PEP-CTERM system associated)
LQNTEYQLNLLSIDVEDWYLSYDSSQIPVSRWHELPDRVEVGVRAFMQLLQNHQLTATFFFLGWVAKRHPALVKEIAEAGHEIGFHSMLHEMPVKKGPEKFEQELEEGLDLLQTITGVRPVSYRAPMFSLCDESRWAIPLLMKHGIRLSSSYKAFQRINGHTTPNAPFCFRKEEQQLIEFPLNRLNLPLLNWVYSGSGYFRMLPYAAIEYFFGRSSYNMAYFHPRDFDTAVPSTPLLPAYRNLMNRTGNSSSLPKLEKLLTKFHFASLQSAASAIDCNSLPLIQL